MSRRIIEAGISPEGTAFASIAASVLLSIGATAAANMENPDASRPKPGISADVNLGMHDVVPLDKRDIKLPGLGLTLQWGKASTNDRAQNESKEVGMQGEVQVVEQKGSSPLKPTFESRTELWHSKKLISKVDMQWARLFDRDPAADKVVHNDAIDTAVNQVLALQKPGTIIERVECIGVASDEDDSADADPSSRNPGFGVPSQKNVDLATLRGQVVSDALQEGLHDTLPTIEVINKTGRERTNNQLADTIIWTAESKGINPVTLVKQYNRGDYSSLTPEEVEIFKGLDDDRYVQCWVTLREHKTSTVELERTTVGEDSATSSLDSITADSSETIETSDDADTEGRRVVLVLIPMILPIPFIRRGYTRSSRAQQRQAARMIQGIASPSTISRGTLPVVSANMQPEGQLRKPVISKPNRAARRNYDRLNSVFGAENTISVQQRAPKVIGAETSSYGKSVQRIKQPREHNMSQSPRFMSHNNGRLTGIRGGKQHTLRGNKR